jgi:hypothetical protein
MIMSVARKFLQFVKQEYPELDSPTPVIYEKSAPIVWARIEEAIHTIPVKEKGGVQTYTHFSNSTPVGKDPYHLHITFTFIDSHLHEMRDILPSHNQDLRSKLDLNAYIKPKGNKSELTLRWNSQALFSNRVRHNQFIKRMTVGIDSLIKHGTQIPQK